MTGADGLQTRLRQHLVSSYLELLNDEDVSRDGSSCCMVTDAIDLEHSPLCLVRVVIIQRHGNMLLKAVLQSSCMPRVVHLHSQNCAKP